MNFKQRLALLFVGLFFLVLTIALSFIYVSYADFRRDEFFERLRQKSETTIRLLAEVNEIDHDLLKIIDKNTINKLYDEKVLVFNEDNRLIYSSLDDEAIPYSFKLIERIRSEGQVSYVDDDGDEVVGSHYKQNGHDYVVLASAYDKYGISKMRNLRELMVGSLVVGTILISVASYFYIRQIFKPIDDINKSIKVINENNLNEFMPVSRFSDELDALVTNYNQMLHRLHKAFESQRSFVRNASHELKTPLAVMYGKLEKLQQCNACDEEFHSIIQSLMDDVDRQASLVESLLLVQRLQSLIPVQESIIRIDEILEESINEVRQRFPELQVNVDITNSITTEQQMMVKANTMLLKICFNNLITNAALYSKSSELLVEIFFTNAVLVMTFSNSGDGALPEKIFEPFFRHVDNQEKPGNGLGLSIVKQVIELMQGTVSYQYKAGQHLFTLTIPHPEL